MVDEDFEELRGDDISPERAERFYDRVRMRIHSFVDSKGSTIGKTAEYLLLVPDVFILLWRLVHDSRVSGKNKVLLGSGIAYYIFPVDLIPEAFFGPIGYLDDLVFGVYILHRVLTDTDASILREHWPGGEDVLAVIQKILGAAESLIGTEMVNRIKRMAK
ncbi:MAG TPA: YkvA family protein [Thermoanaerobaculia bacterium]